MMICKQIQTSKILLPCDNKKKQRHIGKVSNFDRQDTLQECREARTGGKPVRDQYSIFVPYMYRRGIVETAYNNRHTFSPYRRTREEKLARR